MFGSFVVAYFIQISEYRMYGVLHQLWLVCDHWLWKMLASNTPFISTVHSSVA